jgi:NAD(P)-dependent dehydrogenase (short-subunit alcohol dehydrogenase family)
MAEGNVPLIAPRFADRAAIVTGGASGVGKDIARRLVTEGAQVCLWDVNEAAIKAAKTETGAQHSCVVDVSDHAGVAQAAAASNAAMGRTDLLVNSAGITGATSPVTDFPVDNWRRVIEINLNGVFYSCREIVPFMLRNGYGRIVNVSSVAGKEGNPNASAYSAAKAGVIAVTKSLGKELATSGVLVNCVTPAAFDSPLLAQMPASQIDYMKSRIPMGRLGETREVAALICWLLSEECSFSTAATFDISGGRTTY